jgi:hypothetical protein
MKTNTTGILYIINDRGEPSRCDDRIAWSRWFEGATRQIEYTRLPNGLNVSTVFLGVDHNFSDSGSPVLWETMVFGPNGDEDICECYERYANKNDAIEGHDRAIAWAMKRVRTK